VRGTIFFSSENMDQSIPEAINLLDTLDFNGTNYQIAVFNEDFFTAADTNTIYTIPESYFLGGVEIGRNIGDTPELTVTFQGARGIAKKPIQAIEE